MRTRSSRRRFLAAGVGLPAAGLAATSRRSLDTRLPPRFAPQGEPPLSYRTLGRTGLKVTSLGFGAMLTGDTTVIRRAADYGINYFDTGRVYQRGNNERILGDSLGDKRKDVYICTKTASKTKAEALADIDTSLKELRTDYIDIWMLHARDQVEEITDDLLEALETARTQGKTRFVGISTHRTEVVNAFSDHPLIDSILVVYNFTVDEARRDAVAKAAANGKGMIAMKIMSGAFQDEATAERMKQRLGRPGAYVSALKWALKDTNIATAIPSVTNLEHWEENLQVMNEPFTGADEEVLGWQLDYIRPLYCRTCGACDGKCPQGLPASNIVRFLSYAEGYGNFELGRENFLQLDPKLQAVRCAGCDECAIVCPNGVRVAERLTRAQELFA